MVADRITIGNNCIFASNVSIISENHGIDPLSDVPYHAQPLCTGPISIGNNVGMSQSAIICHHSITIGDNVKIGGGVKVYDTNFHSLNPSVRRNRDLDLKEKKCRPVVIEHDAFIGAASIILSGVTIGANSIVGAGSVVTKSIPANEIWGGNPAKFINKVRT